MRIRVSTSRLELATLFRRRVGATILARDRGRFAVRRDRLRRRFVTQQQETSSLGVEERQADDQVGVGAQ